MFGKALSSVRDAIRTGEAWLATQASSQQFCTPTTTGGIHEIFLAPPRPRDLARACPGAPTESSTCCSDTPADSSPEVLAVTPGIVSSLVLPGHGPCLVDGIITLDDSSFATRLRFTAELTPSRPMVGWRSLTLVPHIHYQTRRIGSHALGGGSIRCMRAELRPPFLGWFWRIFPSANVDEHPPQGPVFPSRSSHVLPRSMGLRGTPLGDAACGAAGSRQLDGF